MSYYADLHVHSKYSRATSRDGCLEEFAYWARLKGLAVVATGDFTHPAWLADIREKLVPAEPGLFRLRPEIEALVESRLPPMLRAENSGQFMPVRFGPARFILQVEISTIYKKAGATRKVHHIIFVPDIEAALRLVRRLDQIGNLKSDGRPILGLDSRDLLEIVLESGPGSFLAPAHIWTPWFSALGSKSGFDSIDECYGDLAGSVFAVETGLSSDPPMNWRLSALDRFRLISNSDAHSPSKLAREACVFDTAMDYHALRRALATGEGYGGTVEFFPEEGKYHADGHRACSVRLDPVETRERKGLCPVCGKPVTVGVLSRVEALADRPSGYRPPGASDFCGVIPLREVLAELLETSPASKAVARAYSETLERFGPELAILRHVPPDALREAPALADAIARMREGRVVREAGYDGEFGVIRVFKPGELARAHPNATSPAVRRGRRRAQGGDPAPK
ncbi:MAG: hypothetical protein GX608_03085 [Lentisphaerae bacterium]|nr:hypothetical protein [Lentisphaerota bacterium]